MPFFRKKEPATPPGEPPTVFERDDDLATDAASLADDFVKFAQEQFGTHADYTDASITLVERIAARIDDDRVHGRGPRDPEEFARVMGPYFGFYIGETYRRSHGGEWGWIIVLGAPRTPAIQTPSGGQWWPIVKATKRLLGDRGEDLEYFYQAVCLKV